ARDLKERPELAALGGLIAALAGVGLGQAWLVAAGAAAACAGAILRASIRLRAARLRSAISAALAAGTRREVFERLAGVLEHAVRGEWTGLVSWEEDGVSGELECSRGDAPHDHALMSWLVREADSPEELLTAPAHELGEGDGVFVGLPL